MQRSVFWICLIAAVLACMLTPSAARADVACGSSPYTGACINIIEEGSNSATGFHSGPLFSGNGTETVSFAAGTILGEIVGSTETLQYNIMDAPDYTVLSDTLSLTLTINGAGNTVVSGTFKSDPTTGELNCTGISNCSVQSVDETEGLRQYVTIPSVSSSTLAVGFLSNSEQVPEPAAILLLVAMLTGVGAARKLKFV
jgi:hypothetical protein